MRTFRQTAILGTGLVGGSIGLALRKKKIIRIGFDRPEVLRKALKLRAIDRGAKSWQEAAKEADLVILAMPVGEILGLLPKLAQMVSAATLITDVGGTKAEICSLAAKGLKNFIGGHPLAGKAEGGIENADGKLFADKNWFLCPNDNSVALSRMKTFVRLLGGRPVVIEPEKHDRMLAATSHLPQLVSTLLAATVADLLGGETKRLPVFAGPGFRDTARLGRSSFSVWGDVFASNRLEAGRALELFAQKTAELSDNFPNLEGIQRQFETANRAGRMLK
ncbi:MAG: prephenate dehydrogenase/arogenate dehydrogenase family protein [candidate division Zixibacteria bacterium]|nr:prephenate dehydrogenase/arogenate dehydrogenase family protein [candidate division Zixibacteria bacterium]MCI0596724.1 prephenate dehydrogenase/arogenate dehydrogenase family protein [candidate division Zixibacteria bacterium]